MKYQRKKLRECGRRLDCGLRGLLKELKGDTPWKVKWREGKEKMSPIELTHLMVLAMQTKCLLTAAFLKWAGAYPFMSGWWGTSPLMAAVQSGHEDAVEMLIRDLGGCPYVKDTDGHMPIDWMSPQLRTRLEMVGGSD